MNSSFTNNESSKLFRPIISLYQTNILIRNSFKTNNYVSKRLIKDSNQEVTCIELSNS